AGALHRQPRTRISRLLSHPGCSHGGKSANAAREFVRAEARNLLDRGSTIKLGRLVKTFSKNSQSHWHLPCSSLTLADYVAYETEVFLPLVIHCLAPRLGASSVHAGAGYELQLSQRTGLCQERQPRGVGIRFQGCSQHLGGGWPRLRSQRAPTHALL